MFMNPRISFRMMKFSEQNVEKACWFRLVVKMAVRDSLINFYARDVQMDFMSPIDPWEGPVVADYNYNKVMAVVDENMPSVLNSVKGSAKEAQELYERLCCKVRRKNVLKDRKAKLPWYKICKKISLRQNIQKIDETEYDLYDFLNMVLFLYQEKDFGSRNDFAKVFS